MSRAKLSLEIKPGQGGQLMAGLSAEVAGLANYLVKQDWRRVLDREIRAEGHAGLQLNPLLNPDIQTTPPGSTGPLTLIAQARRGDGKRVLVAGNPTTLWAYTGTEDPSYAVNALGERDYFTSYVVETQAGWRPIASGLFPHRRWEAVAVGNHLVLNNGADLPLTYRPGDDRAFPIYELREQQVASVGTIAVHNGNLLCMDLWQINDADFMALMAAIPAALPAAQNAAGVISELAATLFPGTPITPGLTLFWADGNAAKITAVSGGIITTAARQAVAAGPLSVENPAAYARFNHPAAMQRFPWRVLPSLPSQPRRFGAIIPVSANLNDRQLWFKYPVRSLPELVRYNQAGEYNIVNSVGGSTDITVLYAGPGGSTLTTSVLLTQPDIAMSCLISGAVQSPILATGDRPSSLAATDAANSYAGTFIDLIDDGGAILKALALRDQIVIYKDTPVVFLGTFTGDLTTPYQFQRIPIANEGQSLRYRNTLIAAGGGFYASSHIYAGRNAFYRFDLFTQTPQEIPELQPVQELFFNAAIADPENAWAAENPLTREWFWSWVEPNLGLAIGKDRALCLDYAGKTCRTTSAAITAAARVQHPTRGDWLFLFGSNDGSVQRYGLFDAPIESPAGITVILTPNVATASSAYFTSDHIGKTLVLATGESVAITACLSATQISFTGGAALSRSAAQFQILPGIWHRNGADYDSILETGLGDLGSADGEKVVTRYVAVASSKSAPNAKPRFGTALRVDFKAGVNPSAPNWVQSAVIAAPVAGHNLIQPTFMGYYLGVRLTVSGVNNPFELVNQIWGVLPLGSRSAGRL